MWCFNIWKTILIKNMEYTEEQKEQMLSAELAAAYAMMDMLDEYDDLIDDEILEEILTL